MTRAGKKPHWRDVAESYLCRTCGAGPGDPCLTSNHNRKLEPHADRTNQASANHWEYPENVDPGEPV